MSLVKDGSYINIQPFMVRDLGLKGNELLIYAIIHGFSQDGESKFTGSLQYLADWTNSTKQGVLKVLKKLIDDGLVEKIDIGKQIFAYKAIKQSLPLNKINRSTKFNGTMKQSLTDYETKFNSTIKQSLPNNIDNNINNINTSSSAIELPPQKELDEKAIEFRNDVIELRNIIINATGENPVNVDMVFTPCTYRGIIKPLLAKIKASKFLMGEKETKPKLHTFVRQERLKEILAGLYDDFEKKKTAEIIHVEDLQDKARREKEQEEFERMLGL